MTRRSFMYKYVDVLKCELLGLYLFVVGLIGLYTLMYLVSLTTLAVFVVLNVIWAIYWGDYYSAIADTKEKDNKLIFFNKCLLVSFICGWVMYGCYHASLFYSERINKWVNKE